MMYHFMFGLALSAGTGWAPFSGWPAPVVFCSSIPSTFRVSSLAVNQHPLNSASNDLIDHVKVNPKDNHRDEDHQGGRLDLFAAGKRDLPHFVAYVRQKTRGALGELLEPGDQALLIARHGCCFGH